MGRTVVEVVSRDAKILIVSHRDGGCSEKLRFSLADALSPTLHLDMNQLSLWRPAATHLLLALRCHSFLRTAPLPSFCSSIPQPRRATVCRANPGRGFGRLQRCL